MFYDSVFLDQVVSACGPAGCFSSPFSAMASWAVACRCLTTALATDAEVSQALKDCANLQAAHVPCDGSVHSQLSVALRSLTRHQDDEWLREQAGKVLHALGPATGAMARAIKLGDARAFEGADVRAVALSFAAPSLPAASAGGVSPVASAGGVSPASAPALASTSTPPAASSGNSQLGDASEGTARMILDPSMRSVGAIVLEPTVSSGPCSPQAHTGKRKRKAADLWEPGANVRGWIGRGKGTRLPLHVQVLLVNGYERIKHLPFQTRRDLQALFPPPRGTTAATTLAAQILAGLFAIPARTIEETVRHVKRRRFRPCARPRVAGAANRDPHEPSVASARDPREPSAASAGVSKSPEPAAALDVRDATEQADPPPEAPAGFVNTIRAAMFVASHGLPKSSLSDILWLISAAGGVLHGPQGRALCDVAEHAASACLSSATLADLRRPLPGTGRCPDVEVIADAGSIGQYFRSVRGSILFLGVIYSIAEPPFSREGLLACINAGADERGDATVQKMAKVLARLSPEDWSLWWNMFVAVDCGDGALVKGGPAAKHSSTGAMNKMWVAAARSLGGNAHARQERATWDAFHLFDKAGSAALKEHETGNRLFNLLKRLEWLLGMGQGRIVDQGCAEHLGLQWLGCKSPAGHRKIGYLAGVPDRYMKKFSTFYHASLVRTSCAWISQDPHPR